MSQNVANCQRLSAPGAEVLRSALLDPLRINAALIASIAGLFTVSDAFETSGLGLGHSALLWTLVSLLMVVQTAVTHRLFLALFSHSRFSQILAVALALGATVVLMAIELHYLKFTPLLPKHPDPFLEFVFFVAQPVLAAGCLTLVAQTGPIQSYADRLQQRSVVCDAASDETKQLAALLGQHEILRVSAQDHYLEIVCRDGKFLLRGRMKDALSALAPDAGTQVHRSHWVAHQHIKRVMKQGRDIKLLLDDGAEVPVARSRAHILRPFVKIKGDGGIKF